MRKTRWGYLLGTLLLGVLSACRTSPEAPELTRMPSPSPTVPAVTATLPSLAEIEATPVVEALVFEDPSGQAPPTAAPDPLRFVFPDAGPAPVSAWRPPLYPVPWAPTPYDHFYFSRPIAADEVNWPLANYRYGGVFFENVVHTGVDIPAPPGTPVLAAGEGKIIWAGYGLYRGVLGDLSDPYGMAVVIRHDFGYQDLQLFTVYGHLQRIDIARGQQVLMGDPLGLVGDTGMTTGPHLHFEVRLGTSDFFTSLNPELWLVPPQGWGVAVARILDTAGQLYTAEEVRFRSLQTGQIWKVIPYAGGASNPDPYYQENLALSDLPAGMYEVHINYASREFNTFIQIDPGRVTYFTFRGRDGFFHEPPPDPAEDFNPSEWGSP